MQPIISIRGLEKTYASGHQALKGVDLDMNRGEIFEDGAPQDLLRRFGRSDFEDVFLDGVRGRVRQASAGEARR